jgi:hypothetical protein
LRSLLRYRVKLINARSGERNRISKLLESANIKLSSVVSDLFGVSGRLLRSAASRQPAESGRASWKPTGQVVARSLIQAAGKFYDPPINVTVSQPLLN